MSESKITFREFQDSDYSFCEQLVNQAWKFDQYLQPHEFSVLAKYIYTMGSVAASNYRQVAMDGDSVIGFIFGFNEQVPLAKHSLLKLSSRLAILKRLLFMKGLAWRRKMDFLNAMGLHEKNRLALVKRGQSEIVLFVVNPAYQGKGIGKQLFAGFREFCRHSDVSAIIVETNRLGAAQFYERIGFTLIGDFESPLHNLVTKDGQACMYEYRL